MALPDAPRLDAAGPADADALVALLRACRAEDGYSMTGANERAMRAIAAGEPMARAWILREGGEAIGFLVLTLGYSVEYGGRDGFIDDLYLVPATRGRGLGRWLVATAIEQAATLGIGTLHLEVEVGNDPAEALYRAAGFEETGRRLMRRRITPPLP
ncbi:MAG TPA: GNAT family N-acetyltransferase [Acetobacteraceae bacterium]|nr:GNAT family N-acetyltransferase [Acetobacteraceae bacterium]